MLMRYECAANACFGWKADTSGDNLVAMDKAARVHAYARKTRRQGRIFIPIWIACVAVGTSVAAMDAIWKLGWGYDWGDVLGGLGMMVGGVVFWFAWNWIFKIHHSLTETFHGPDVERRDVDQSFESKADTK